MMYRETSTARGSVIRTIVPVVGVVLCIIGFHIGMTGRIFGAFIDRFAPCTQNPANSFPCYGSYDIGLMAISLALGIFFLVLLFRPHLIARMKWSRVFAIAIVGMAVVMGVACYIADSSAPVSPLTPRSVQEVEVPDGWYEHFVVEEGNANAIILTKYADLPPTHMETDDLYDDPEIVISTTTESVSPEEYVEQYVQEKGSWNTFRGYKIFILDTPQGRDGNALGYTVVLFKGDIRYGFTLVSSSDVSQDAVDFWKVIAWYAGPPPSWVTADQVIVEDATPPISVEAGYQGVYHSLVDMRHNVTFNAPINWKPQVLPEGDGEPSMVSPDFSDPLGAMKGAYIHYSIVTELPDSFKGNPDGYLASLKQGLTWSDTTFDGHAAYITRNDNGYAMVVSKFSDNLIVTISFDDPGKKYGTVFDEFLRSFHVQQPF